MDCFKRKTGIDHIYPITVQTVETVLGKEAPYYEKRGDSGTYFAVCPACDNPIQIVGIFRNSAEGGRNPYGKHHGKDIPNLARYREIAYRDCPYSNSHYSPAGLRPKSSYFARQYLSLLREQFDRVVYILEQDTGIHISERTARHMIREYIANEGWRYRNSSLNNLPWKFAHSEKALPLFGRIVKRNSALAQALSQSCPAVELVPVGVGEDSSVKIAGRQKQFVDLKYYFCKHNVYTSGNAMKEDITLRVYRTDTPENAVFEQIIPIETDRFIRLVNLPAGRSRRNERLLRVAEEEIQLP